MKKQVPPPNPACALHCIPALPFQSCLLLLYETQRSRPSRRFAPSNDFQRSAVSRPDSENKIAPFRATEGQGARIYHPLLSERYTTHLFFTPPSLPILPYNNSKSHRRHKTLNIRHPPREFPYSSIISLGCGDPPRPVRRDEQPPPFHFISLLDHAPIRLIAPPPSFSPQYHERWQSAHDRRRSTRSIIAFNRRRRYDL